MRILCSEFHDYYDVVQATGQDQTLLYVRRPKKEEMSEFPFPSILDWGRRGGKAAPIIRQYIVGFCGRIYPVLHLHQTSWNYATVEAVCHTLVEVDAFIESHYRDKEIEEYKTKLKRRHWRMRYWDSNLTRTSFEKFFNKCEEQKDAFAQMFLDHQCPVFVAHCQRPRWLGFKRWVEGEITWNGSLREHQFVRLFDPYTAFQEISMFMGNLAVPLKPIPEISDKTMAEAKGFDKFSFRKPKEK